MAESSGQAEPLDFTRIWQVPDVKVAAGLIPGYVGAVRIGGRIEVRARGRTGIEAGSAPMTPDSLFRIASVTKPLGGALTLSLVQDGVLTLDDPIARWLPEAAHPRVLTKPDAALDDTVPAVRSITIRHLLTNTSGWGAVMQPSPLQAAMFERGVFPGPLTPQMSGDEFVARVTALPLGFQPGEGFLYDTGIDVLGVVLARATGKPLSELFAERITGPFGMASTAFQAVDPSRLVTAYQPGHDGLELRDRPDGMFSRPPAFEELGSGLVSTASDVLAFYSAMADGGAPLLSAPSLTLMTSDALPPHVREQGYPIVERGASWGLGTGVDVEPAGPWMAPGRWGWTGGSGTMAYVDPSRDTVSVLLTQREMAGPQDGFDDFCTAVAQIAEALRR
jgi:CubicO group peptidase (beta-lactamase class C family)